MLVNAVGLLNLHRQWTLLMVVAVVERQCKATGVSQVMGLDSRQQDSVFFRMTTDKQTIPTALEQSFSSAVGSSCFLIGGGPSLNQLEDHCLEPLPIPRMCLNLAGTGKFRPHIWTAYDPTQRFSRSTYLDASVLKVLHRRRAMDLVPETNWKVCECPNICFFEGDRERGFSNFISPLHRTIIDWNDTFLQGIDIAYRLGFRVLYLLGCEMKILPGSELLEWASQRQLSISANAGLTEFIQEIEKQGARRQELKIKTLSGIYHFQESKSLQAAINSDFHYYRVVQYLRLARQALNDAGLKIVSLTPDSRLNDFFPHSTLSEVAKQIHEQYGNPREEQTDGRYRSTAPRPTPGAGMMRDFLPLNWPKAEEPDPPPPCSLNKQSTLSNRVRSLQQQLSQCQQAEIVVEEQG